MAVNNALAKSKEDGDKKNEKEQQSKKARTTILDKGTVESRGIGTNVNSVEVISDEILNFIHGEAKFGLRSELRGFFTVWTFITRLPGPIWVDHHPGFLMIGMAYFPLGGFFIGLFVNVFFDFGRVALGLPSITAALISMISSLWITGCFHEDGLADSSDGIGGGWTRSQVLKIMTDTRLGTYGCAILIVYITMKTNCIAVLNQSSYEFGNCAGAGPAIIVTNMLSRLSSPILLRLYPYVDEFGPKYQFYSFMIQAKHLVTWRRVLFAVASSFLVAYVAYGFSKALILILIVCITSLSAGQYGDFILGGVMGDYLGATICVTESVLYVCIIILSSISSENLTLDSMIEWFYSMSDIVDFEKKEEIFQNIQDLLNANPRFAAFVNFAIVIIFTIIWCSNVGHPNVFVRDTVASYINDNDANDDENEITYSSCGEEVPIALTPKEEKKTESQTKNVSKTSALLKVQEICQENSSFPKRYEKVHEYLDSLAKPVGSLGTLEHWASQYASLRFSSLPEDVNNLQTKCVIFAGDHGVAKTVEEGGEFCSLYPQSVTKKILQAFEAGVAGASVLTRQQNIPLTVVDVGVAGDSSSSVDGTVVKVANPYKVQNGTKNFCVEDAMTREQVLNCITAGRVQVSSSPSADIIVLGEIGIGNTTTSSALIAYLTNNFKNVSDLQKVCGGGATVIRNGTNEKTITKKASILKKAFERQLSSSSKKEETDTREQALMALTQYGGCEIAALVGAMLECSDQNKAVLVDGFIVSTAALVASFMDPQVIRVFFFATQSTEPGQQLVLETIAQIAKDNSIFTSPSSGFILPPPCLNMNLRLGEGSGGLLAVPILKSAIAILLELATLGHVLSLE